jgi:hypothetical protein
MSEARQASKRALPRLADFESSRIATGNQTSAAEMVSEFLRDAETTQDRAQRALKLLCDDRAASVGYLYLVNDTGLAFVTCHGAAAPPEGLFEYVREYFDREVSSAGDETAALTSTQMRSALTARSLFRDSKGVNHQSLLMTSIAGGGVRQAGVAVLVEGVRPPPSPIGGANLVAALSAHLIQSGDTRGVAG